MFFGLLQLLLRACLLDLSRFSCMQRCFDVSSAQKFFDLANSRNITSDNFRQITFK